MTYRRLMAIREKRKPLYLKAHESGRLSKKVKKAYEMIERCGLCARNCQVNRRKGEKGFCEITDKAVISSEGAHFGEEAPLVGRHGSGTLFLTSCNLLCLFCQNDDLSHGKEGAVKTPREIAAMMVSLQKRGCHNINFVTPSHQMPFLIDALMLACDGGLAIPVVWNCGGYESVEALSLLEGIVDIYMPDFKFWKEEKAELYCGAADYPEVARRSLEEMHRQVGDLLLDGDQIAYRGLLVRHLVMPGMSASSGEIMKWIAEKLSPQTYVNVMAQYRPCYQSHRFPEIDHHITTEEYAEALQAARSQGLRVDQEYSPRRGRLLF
jgi:putative pyruvate formate lyase activating enzyme